MILTYKYRLNLKKHQHKSLEKALEDSRILYNSALEERISAWKNNRINVSKFDHFQSLTQSYKAERAGGKVVEINPKNTSQTCSACSTIVKKDLKERVHQCDCGWTLDRDLNAAYNIEKKAFCSSLWLDQAIKNYKKPFFLYYMQHLNHDLASSHNRIDVLFLLNPSLQSSNMQNMFVTYF